MKQIKTIKQLKNTINLYVKNLSKEDRKKLINDEGDNYINAYYNLLEDIQILKQIEDIQNKYYQVSMQIKNDKKMNFLFMSKSLENSSFIDVVWELDNYYNNIMGLEFHYPKIDLDRVYLNQFIDEHKTKFLNNIKEELKELGWDIKTEDIEMF